MLPWINSKMDYTSNMVLNLAKFISILFHLKICFHRTLCSRGLLGITYIEWNANLSNCLKDHWNYNLILILSFSVIIHSFLWILQATRWFIHIEWLIIILKILLLFNFRNAVPCAWNTHLFFLLGNKLLITTIYGGTLERDPSVVVQSLSHVQLLATP